jgi:PIF1-like helicase
MQISFVFRWKLLNKAALIIVDEVAMAPSPIFSILDTVMRRIYDAHGDHHPMFAGKVVLFGGDMRQLGPIPNDGQTMSQLHFRNTPAFAEATSIHLNINMRTASDEKDFAEFLRQVGEGRTPPRDGMMVGCVEIAHDLIIKDLKSLINWTFGDDPSTSGASSAILTPYNKDCYKINKLVIDSLPGQGYQSLSEDSVIDDTSTNRLLADVPLQAPHCLTTARTAVQQSDAESQPDHPIAAETTAASGVS